MEKLTTADRIKITYNRLIESGQFTVEEVDNYLQSISNLDEDVIYLKLLLMPHDHPKN